MAGTAYVLFYVLVTNAVGTPDPGVTIPPALSNGYLIPFAAYGPMTVWPDLEFYSPILNLVGYFSVGNILLFASFGFLTAFVAALHLLPSVQTADTIELQSNTIFLMF